MGENLFSEFHDEESNKMRDGTANTNTERDKLVAVFTSDSINVFVNEKSQVAASLDGPWYNVKNVILVKAGVEKASTELDTADQASAPDANLLQIEAEAAAPSANSLDTPVDVGTSKEAKAGTNGSVEMTQQEEQAAAAAPQASTVASTNAFAKAQRLKKASAQLKKALAVQMQEGQYQIVNTIEGIAREKMHIQHQELLTTYQISNPLTKIRTRKTKKLKKSKAIGR